MLIFHFAPKSCIQYHFVHGFIKLPFINNSNFTDRISAKILRVLTGQHRVGKKTLQKLGSLEQGLHLDSKTLNCNFSFYAF